MKKLRGIFFQMGLIIAGGLTLLAFEWKSSYIITIPTNTEPIVSIEDWDIAPILPEKEVIKKVKIERPKVVINSHDFTPVDNKTKIIDPIDKKEVVVTPPFNPDEWKLKEKEETTPVTWAEVMPTFVGGEKALFKYLGKVIKYPQIDIENNITGTVHVQFVVDKNGEITNVKILRGGVSPTLNAEAIRVVKAMPNWKPGRQHGKRVSVIYHLPIKFGFKE